MRIILSATCLALIVSGTAVAQVTHLPAAGPGIGNPAGTAPGTRDESPGKPAPRQSNLADRAFALTAASGGLAEVELANLAQQVSHSDAIKAFARQMVQDHSKANRKLTEIGAQQSIPLAHGLTPIIDRRTRTSPRSTGGNSTPNICFCSAGSPADRATPRI